MASILTRRTNNARLIQFYDAAGKRKYIQLGKVTQKQAQAVLIFIEDLVASRITGTSPQKATSEWLASLPQRAYDRLVRSGLVQQRQSVQKISVAKWIRSYIDGRTDVKPNTLLNYNQVCRYATEFFGTKNLDEVGSADADAFRVYLKSRKLSESTVRRTCKRVRQFFTAAIRRKLITENPFEGMACGTVANNSRHYFITQEMATKIIAACPDNEWRLIFALCRYGGLRCPSELLTLKWEDVDWAKPVLHVVSSKKENIDGGYRDVPIFPELLPHLREAFDNAPEGAVYVIAKYRDPNVNLRSRFRRIVQSAGLKIWPRIFHNLRSTRQTELEEEFSIKTVCQWLGNSPEVALKHYMQVRDDSLRKAVESAQSKAQLLRS